MKKLLFCLLIAAVFFSCSEDHIINDATDGGKTETKSVLRERQKYYTLAYKISNTYGKLAPGAIASDGNLLTIANINPNLYGIDIYSLENGIPLPAIREWSHKDSIIRPQHVPTALCIHNNRIYLGIADEGKVYVFDTQSFHFITTIGNGNIQVDKPSDDKFAVGAPCTIVGDGDKLLIRSRKHIRIYDTADITPENYEAVPYYAAEEEEYPIQPTTLINQGYVGYANYIYLTDADQKQVLAVKPLASIPAGDAVAIVEDAKSFSSAPSGAAISEDRAYLSFGTKKQLRNIPRAASDSIKMSS